jgi:hypothetical protein
MRRQHQVVTLAHPGYMIAKSAPIRFISLFPLDWYVFIEPGHVALSGSEFYSSRGSSGNQDLQPKNALICNLSGQKPHHTPLRGLSFTPFYLLVFNFCWHCYVGVFTLIYAPKIKAALPARA